MQLKILLKNINTNNSHQRGDSAKNNNNVDKLFEYFTYKLIDYYENNKEKYLWNDNDSNSVKFKDLDSNEETEKKCSC